MADNYLYISLLSFDNSRKQLFLKGSFYLSLFFYISPLFTRAQPMKLNHAVILIAVVTTFSCTSNKENVAFNKTYERLSLLRNESKFEEALNTCDTLVELASNASELGLVYWIKGYIYDITGEQPNAQVFYTGAADAYLSDKNYVNAVKLYQNAGTVALNAQVLDIALNRYRKRLSILKKVDADKRSLAIANYEIGLVFLEMRDLDSANFYQNNVLDLIPPMDSIATDAFIELGIIQYHLDQFDSARIYYDKALKGYNNPVRQNKIHNNIGYSYMAEKNYELAKESFWRAKKIGKTIGINRALVKPFNNLGKLYFELGIRDSAMFYLKAVQGLHESYQTPSSRAEMYKLGYSRSALHDLSINYQYMIKMDSIEAVSMIQETILPQMSMYLESLDVMASEETKRSIQLANADRNQTRLLRRLKEYENRDYWNGVYIAIFCFLFVGLSLFLLFNRKRTVNFINDKVQQSQNRLRNMA